VHQSLHHLNVTTHCTALQCTTAHCNACITMQHTTTRCHIRATLPFPSVPASPQCYRPLQHTATHNSTLRQTPPTAPHCNTQQHTATHCNTLQHTATHCNTLHHTSNFVECIRPCITSMSPPTALHCNTQQHTATHCNTLQHTTAHSSTLQHAAPHERLCRVY